MPFCSIWSSLILSVNLCFKGVTAFNLTHHSVVQLGLGKFEIIICTSDRLAMGRYTSSDPTNPNTCARISYILYVTQKTILVYYSIQISFTYHTSGWLSTTMRTDTINPSSNNSQVGNECKLIAATAVTF